MNRIPTAAATLVAAAVLVASCTSTPGIPTPATGSQYPAGQRPCPAVLDALGQVATAQLHAGAGAADPNGTVRAALATLARVLRDRAGQSTAFAADAYNSAADRLAGTLSPLVDAYEHHDDAAYYSATGAFSSAVAALTTECRS